MTNGYKILWTDHALEELSETIQYLETFFSEKEINRLANKIEETITLISQNPLLFPVSDTKNVRKINLLKFNTIYYRIKNDTVEIISFFSNRQNPEKRNF